MQDLARIKEGICAAFSSRQFEAAAALCGEGLRLELDDKAANAHFHSERAKAFQLLGRSRARGETRREREDAAKAKAGGAAEPAGLRELAAGEAAPPEDEGDPRAGAPACWKRCLQEASKAIYLEPTLLQPYLLKAESLQALERWKEALTAMEQVHRVTRAARRIAPPSCLGGRRRSLARMPPRYGGGRRLRRLRI